MLRKVKVLTVEDSEDDALLLAREFRRSGLDAEFTRVDTLEALCSALREREWDIVLCDYAMPRYSGMAALRTIREVAPDLPVIFVSGTMGEDVAVEAMRAGANDYLMKDNLKRLVPAVERELRDRVERRERRQAEAALRESEAKFRTLAETAPVGILIHQGGRCRYVNAVFETATGYTREELLAMNFWDQVHPDFRELVRERGLARCRGERPPGRYEFKILTKAGEERWTDLQATWLEFEGQPAVLATLFDITQRRAAETALRESEARYRFLAENITDVVWVFEVSTMRFTYVSPSIARLRGYTSKEALTQPLDQRLAPGSWARVQSKLPARLQAYLSGDAGAVTQTDILEQMRKDGTPVWTEVVSTFVGDAKTGVQVIGVSRDISERHRIELALQRNEAELSAIYDHAPVMMLLMDEDLHLCRLNRAAIAFAGRPAEEVRGLPVGALLGCFHALDDPRGCGYGEACGACALRGAMKDTLTQGTTRHRVLAKPALVRGEGVQEFFVLASTALVEVEGQRRVLLCLEDITEKKSLETQFYRAQRMESIGTLASGVAHDLNNILAPILMAVDLLRPLARQSADQEAFDLLENSARRGADIVRQLLTFGRGLEGERGEFQPRALLKEMAEIIRETFPKSITLEPRFPEDLWTLRADATQIHQVLMNLCVNARDAMPQGGRLTLAAENLVVDEDYARLNPEAKPGPYVVLHVMDTGTGISPGVIDKIFDPFFTTKDPGKGTGLGLATVLGIVKSHGGFVRVQSQPGQGTQFHAYLPAAGSPGAGSSERVDPVLLQGHGELVLLVDDEESMREIARRMLESCGYRVLTAADGVEGLAAFRSQPKAVQVLVTDMVMPILDGVALIRAARQIEPGLRVVAMSGLHSHEEEALGPALRADAFLSKPFPPDRLVATVHKVLGSRVVS